MWFAHVMVMEEPALATLGALLYKTRTLMADGCSMECYLLVRFLATRMTKALLMGILMSRITMKGL